MSGHYGTSPCSPRAPNLLHVLPSRMVGWHNLCSPGHWCFLSLKKMENSAIWWYDDHKTASQKNLLWKLISDMLIFVSEPIKTIVKMQFCPLRITPSPPIRYISNGKFAPKFDLVFTFHWGFLSTYLLIIISGTHLLTIFWALQFTPSSCCDDTNFGKKWKHKRKP